MVLGERAPASRCSLETYSSLKPFDCSSASSRSVLEAPAHVEVGGRAAHLRLGVERRFDVALDRGQVDADFTEEGRDDPLLLGEQRREQVLGRELLVAATLRERLRLLERLLGLGGELVHPHVNPTVSTTTPTTSMTTKENDEPERRPHSGVA